MRDGFEGLLMIIFASEKRSGGEFLAINKLNMRMALIDSTLNFSAIVLWRAFGVMEHGKLFRLSISKRSGKRTKESKIISTLRT